MVLDEAWLFLDHPMFAAKIREWLKTLRKLNVSVVFATQSVDDTLSSSIASALIESCPSRIFLPNDRALEPNVRKAYEQLGLNERQIQILAHAIPKRQYYFESSQGNALFELGLGEFTLAFCGVNRALVKQTIKELWQNQGAAGFVEAYLEYCNIPWALELARKFAEQSHV